jgi:3-oxoacyl-[acyl-carrier-protein] synthase III
LYFYLSGHSGTKRLEIKSDIILEKVNAYIMQSAYITRLSKYLPNKKISNDEMENYIGKAHGNNSLSQKIALKRNKITGRYYALDENGNTTHTNAQLSALAIEALTGSGFEIKDIELLCCGTTSPDQILPSHASMTHGLLKTKNIEIASFSGACCTGMQALKYGYMSVLSGNSSNAVCVGSERISRWMKYNSFEETQVDENSNFSFNKEFLRWMLSDGAGAALIQDNPTGKINLRIEWIDVCSYADRMETCMYAGSDKLSDGSVKGWNEYEPTSWLDESVFSLKQDVKLLGANIVPLGLEFLSEIIVKRNFDVNTIDYFLPHISSYFFENNIKELLIKYNLNIPDDKWFLNLAYVGNVGAASVYLMLEELFNSGKLKKGQKILLMVPESSRFIYSFSLLTVC